MKDRAKKNREKIVSFINEHHLLTLATLSADATPYVNSAFYFFNEDEFTFVIASDEKTEHIQNIRDKKSVAVAIALETKEVGKIRGVQIKAQMFKTDDKSYHDSYFQAFPYARVMQPTLWILRVTWVKFTDNRLGFGKKIELSL